MLDELLKKISDILREFEEQYYNAKEFYEKIKPHSNDNIEALKKVRDDEKLDYSVRLLASLAVVSETRTMADYTSYMMTLNTLTRLSLMTEHSITVITNELSQLKQQAPTPLIEAQIEKISEIETELAKLNKEFKKYSPTLKKFKQALDHTEKILRDNR